ncbi:hypothetical protein BDK88_3428 [Natrinema hispanicum]|uniref:Uncharacterized protein n=1 Tax=Natrinema hispanicum TaxID=392421 RepID=A0A482Y322_9EURY|nr:hypothetical protein BDK88_3428 [Natrinema hispanicum]
MTDPVPLSSSQIDRQLESVLSDTEEAGLPLVREVLQEPRDRWYGQLVGHAYASLTTLKILKSCYQLQQESNYSADTSAFGIDCKYSYN